MNAIPEIINAFNVYNKGKKFMGISGAVTLPTMDAITETINGAGILGEYETSVPGHFGSMEQEIPFRVLEEGAFEAIEEDGVVNLTFRASEQSTVQATSKLKYSGMRIVERGRLKGINAGSLENGKQMSSSLTIEVLYYMVEIDGSTVIELDKLNSIFKLNGNDMLAKVHQYS